MATTGTILTVLSNIPWGKVVDNAPKLADGAARLWGAVRKRGDAAAEEGAAEVMASNAPPEATAAEQLAARLAGRVEALEGRVAELQAQLAASSELVKDLAEQNAQLVQRIELHQQQLRRLALGGAAVAVVLTAGLALLLVFWR
jgi:TolA-binding protein